MPARRGAWRRRPGRGSPGRRSGSTQRAAEAIIAALSVQSSGGGTFSSTPSPAARSRSTRVGRHAAAEREPRARLGRPARARRAGSAPRRSRARRRRRGRRRARARLLLPQVAHRVEQRGLQAREGEVEARDARGGRERERGRVARSAPASTAPARPDSGSPSSRAPLSNASPGRVVERAPEHLVARPARSRAPAACGRPRRAGTGTAAPSARARGRWRRRAPAGGRPARAAAAAPRRGPSRSPRRRAARRRGPGPA